MTKFSEMGNLEDGNDQYWYLNLPEEEPKEEESDVEVEERHAGRVL